MKSNVLNLTILFVLLVSSMQLWAQCYSSQSDEYWRIGSTYGSSKVSNCISTYNCFGFMRSYFENSCQPTQPYYNYPPGYTCPEIQGIKNNGWKVGGNYIKVCNEASANIVYYEGEGIDGGHAAVKVGIIGGAQKYISKYGSDGPLVSHNLNGSWYHYTKIITLTEFWSYLGSISGISSVVGTASQNYTVASIPGVTYSWSMTSGGENIYISSQSGNTVTLSPLHSGSAVLSLTATSTCGGTATQQLAISVQTNSCLEGTYMNNSSIIKNLNNSNSVSAGWVQCTVTCPNAASYTWQRTSGSISYYNSGNFLSFNITSGASVSFLVTARNSANSILGSRNLTFYNYGSYRAFPNPASSSLKIDVSEETPVTVVIHSLKESCLKEIQDYESKSSIDISDLEDGEYIVRVYHNGKLANRERIKIVH